MADDYDLSAAQTKVFLWRFNEENKNRRPTEIQKYVKEALKIEVESYIKQMGVIYSKFKPKRRSPGGCPELNYDGPHKFSKLLNWLQKQYGESESFEYPEGCVPLNSPFYIERDGVDSLCYNKVREPGSLIRIKAPKFLGKTSLMRRILTKTAGEKSKNVYIDWSAVENSVLTDLEKLERWFCTQVVEQLHIENKLNDYWNEEFRTVNDNCTYYFENYIFAKINCPLVLGLDEVDSLFSETKVAENFFIMLRKWHEEGKISQTWQQLRIVLAHATEISISFDINQSPFNVGLPVDLPEFNQNEIERLARLYGLKLNKKEMTDFMAMVGGNPYLVRLGFYKLAEQKISMKELLISAPTQGGIYSDRLRKIFQMLENSPEIKEAFNSVVTSSQGVVLKPQENQKLCSLGLVKAEKNCAIPSCSLYREYFKNVFSL